MISSDEKEETIENLMVFLKNQMPENKITLITDDYPAYMNAWARHMPNVKHIQCLWHIKKNLRLNLSKHKITGNLTISNNWL